MEDAMKKTLSIFCILSLCFTPALFAQMPLGMPVAPAVAPAVEKIGVVAAAQGKIELKNPGQIGRIAQSGQAVFMGDEITTGEKGHLQIMFLDETIFTIGPNSSITLDEFVYDPNNHEGKIQASIAKGVFRYVSGKIAAKQPNNVTVKLPAATLGFRGTIVGGQVNPDGSGLAALLGPGAQNDANAWIGHFTIRGKNGNFRDVNRTGFGVEVGADGDLSGVFQLSDEQVHNLTRGLAPSGGSGHGGGSGSAGAQGGALDGGNMSNLSGETGALTAENGSIIGSLSQLTDGLDDASNQAAQDAAANNEKVPDGITTLEQLTRVATGIYHFYGEGTYVPSHEGSGSQVKAWCDINFGSKEIGGGNSRIEILDRFGSVLDRTRPDGQGVQNFSNMSGPAVFNWTDAEGNYGTFNNIELKLFNSGGVTANQATVTAGYTNTEESESARFGPDSGSGSASGSRVAGESPAPPKD